MLGNTVVYSGDFVTQAFYTLSIDLAPTPHEPTPETIAR